MWNIRVYLGISTEVRDDGDLDWDDGRGEQGVDWFWKDRGQGSWRIHCRGRERTQHVFYEYVWKTDVI